MDAQTTKDVQVTRPGQRKTEHDRSDIFRAPGVDSSSPALNIQPEQAKMTGSDFARDPMNSKKPMMTFEEIMSEDLEYTVEFFNPVPELRLPKREKADLVAFMRQL